MSLPDVVRNVAKSVRDAFSDRDGLKEKAKDLPLNALNTTISGVGQALTFGDRVRATLKRLGAKDENKDENKDAAKELADDKSTASATETATAAETAETTAADTESKPARRQPVIFAPRGGKSAKPEADAKPEAEPKTEPVAEKPVEKPAEPKAAEKPVEKPAAEPAAEAAAPVVETPAPAPAPAPVAEAPAPAEVAAPVETVTEKAAETVTEKAAEEPVEEPKPARAKRATKPKAPAAAAASNGELPEPMPNYSELTLASLRARLRNKSADEVRALLTYEQATANRANIVKMFENRLAKMAEAGGE
ncbi:hypothetical protein [Spongiactinospora sp. TRM90649]|uniref:hypothetical protein n=1 Tax=Spongiactinospora sp. TRM90649 TaxID=3031114 RepID=UPI0023F862DE|nr:hypothetical protein [Spongiactinospora sp. TRM90649]MDF5754709.1 hypothetical protein [Spongiactinospora sp. TRM90649]